MKIVKGTLWSIDTIDLGEMFRQRSVRLEHGRVNEILFYEVYSEYPTSYTKMLSEDYLTDETQLIFDHNGEIEAIARKMVKKGLKFDGSDFEHCLSKLMEQAG